MSDTDKNWEERFNEKFGKKKAAQQEQRKSFQTYKRFVLEAFSLLERKVVNISEITITKNLIARTEEYRRDVKGELDSINVMRLRCENSHIELVPEGINFSNTKGRIRIRHNAKSLDPFLYLSLVVDPESDKPYPSSLVWVLVGHDGRGDPPRTGRRFTESLVESLLETAFLED